MSSFLSLIHLLACSWWVGIKFELSIMRAFERSGSAAFAVRIFFLSHHPQGFELCSLIRHMCNRITISHTLIYSIGRYQCFKGLRFRSPNAAFHDTKACLPVYAALNGTNLIIPPHPVPVGLYVLAFTSSGQWNETIKTPMTDSGAAWNETLIMHWCLLKFSPQRYSNSKFTLRLSLDKRSVEVDLLVGLRLL